MDKLQAKTFVFKLIGQSSENFTDEDFEVVFQEFDADGSGKIDKNEMACFIKKVTGLQY